MADFHVLRNQLLARLTPAEWSTLRGDAEYVRLAAGHTIARPGDPVESVYFPESGLVSVVSTMESGHHVEVAAIGPDGLLGSATVLYLTRYPYWAVVQVESEGYRIAAERFRERFNAMDSLRNITLRHLGTMLQELARSAGCNRFHSHRERLARWLLVTMDKSGNSTMDLTHDFIAQMVGGPRHAVTAALQDLRAAGAIDYLRGRIQVLDRDRLVSSACECYRTAASFTAIFALAYG